MNIAWIFARWSFFNLDKALLIASRVITILLPEQTVSRAKIYPKISFCCQHLLHIKHKPNRNGWAILVCSKLHEERKVYLYYKLYIYVCVGTLKKTLPASYEWTCLLETNLCLSEYMQHYKAFRFTEMFSLPL